MLKSFVRLKLVDFQQIGNDLATFEIDKNSPSSATQHSSSDDRQQPKDYSDFLHLSDSILNDDEKLKFKNLFGKYRDVFVFLGDQLGRTSLVQHVIDTGDAMPMKQRSYKASPDVNKKKLTVKWTKCLRKESFMSLPLPRALQLFWSKSRMNHIDFVLNFRKLIKSLK